MNIIRVLRLPSAPNAHYHAECYTPIENDLVCGVLRLKDDQSCAVCGGLIPAGLHTDDQQEETKLEQLSLF